MKKFEITQEQIEQLINFHPDNEKPFKQWFPKAFKTELEVGKWHKNKYDSLFCIQEIKGNSVFGYGFSHIGPIWSNRFNWSIEKITEATPEEVEFALIAEAKRRGYKTGVFCEFGIMKDVRAIKSSIFMYDEKRNGLYMGYDEVFVNGKWSPIIESITKAEAEKILNKKIV